MFSTTSFPWRLIWVSARSAHTGWSWGTTALFTLQTDQIGFYSSVTTYTGDAAFRSRRCSLEKTHWEEGRKVKQARADKQFYFTTFCAFVRIINQLIIKANWPEQTSLLWIHVVVVLLAASDEETDLQCERNLQLLFILSLWKAVSHHPAEAFSPLAWINKVGWICAVGSCVGLKINFSRLSSRNVKHSSGCSFSDVRLCCFSLFSVLHSEYLQVFNCLLDKKIYFLSKGNKNSLVVMTYLWIFTDFLVLHKSKVSDLGLNNWIKIAD